MAEILREMIARGRWPTGRYLPSEPVLARALAVSRHTLRHALRQLIGEGALAVERGRGTVVVTPRLERELRNLTGFVEDMVALGVEPSARVLFLGRVAAPAPVGRALGVRGGSRVVALEWLRFADDRPVAYDRAWLPLGVGRELRAEHLERAGLIAALEDKCGVALTEADYRLTARDATAHVARALGLKAGEPVLEVARTSYAASGPVAHEQLFYPAGLMTYRLKLRRR